MKNTKLNIRKLSRSGFSLVEMLVVIAIIGIMAAIAIPSITGINESAVRSSTQRNAQNIVSIFAAAKAAGATLSATRSTAIGQLKTGVQGAGVFSGKLFKLGAMTADEQTAAETYVGGDGSDLNPLTYLGTATPTSTTTTSTSTN